MHLEMKIPAASHGVSILQSKIHSGARLNLCTKVTALVAGLLLLTSCASTPVYQPADVEARDVSSDEPIVQTDPSPEFDPELATDALEVEDLNSSRARYYEQQAQQSRGSKTRIDSALSSAEYYIQANDYRNAEQVALSLANSPLDRIQSDRLRVINAYVAYSLDDYTTTLAELRPVIDYVPPVAKTIDSTLPSIPVKPRLSTQQVDALLLSSFAYQKLGDFDSAINALIEREGSLVGAARVETTRYIWQVINSLPVESRRMLIESSRYPLVRNRLEQSLGTQVGPASQAPQQFTQWREESDNRLKQSINNEWNASSPRSIAVLLPLTSRFAKAANAVLDGINHQQQQNLSAYRPEIRVYDIGENPFLAKQYYSAAVQSGADFIIGPLGKDYANQVNSFGSQGTPTLMLGGDTPLAGGISRFSMGPEMEGQRVAERAWKDGHLSAALLVPEDASSQRSVNAFTQRWLEYGGKINKVIPYSPKQYDHSVELKQLFDINQSRYRHSRLSTVLGFKPKFSPYLRSDIDFVFMIASNTTGRLVRPQINFFSGGRVPVYATSSIFNGIQDPINNVDLDNTRFPVMPWVLKSADVAPYAGQLNMLFAMGSDAYTIAGNYHTLRSDLNAALNGNTGQISINSYGEAIYQPVWARFREGQALAEDTLGIDISPIYTRNSKQQGRFNSKGNYNDSNWDKSKGQPRRRTGG